MKIKPEFLRDFLSVIFSLFYLIFAEEADEKVTIEFSLFLFLFMDCFYKVKFYEVKVIYSHQWCDLNLQIH